MKRILPYLFIAAIVTLFASCVKSKSDKLIGVWQYEKVKLRDFGNNTDLTEQYLNSSMKFNEDGTASFYNSQTKEIKEGTWEFYSYETWDNNNNESETITDLYIFLLDTSSNIYNEEIWRDINLTSKKITTTVDQFDGSTLRYELMRVVK